MISQQVAALRAVGQIEGYLCEIAVLKERLEQIPLWQPAAVLRRQAAEARRLITAIQARMDRRLVVTLIGPSGAGKSTLLNALAGVDDVSPVGTRRPTTQNLVVLSNDRPAVDQLLAPVNAGTIDVHTSPAAELLDHAILVDTPDTDSMEEQVHKEILVPLVEHSDVLICVFDAQNPKRRDHADFMAPLVRRFHGAALVVAINKCDRLDARELTEEVGPDVDAYLKTAWQVRPAAVLLISARRHLQQPGWDSQAGPRHELDQFAQLREVVFASFDQAGFGKDVRIANAGQIRDFIVAEVGRAARQDRRALQGALEKMNAAGRTALQQALETLRMDDRHRILGVQVRLYQALAQRWLGPVGWLVAIWSRLIVFGGGLASLVRFGNPIRQLWAAFSSWRRYKESRAALAALEDDTRVDQALQAFHKTVLTHWPDIAEQLIAGHFDAQVRRTETQADNQVGRDLETIWADRLEARIESSAKALSHWVLQLLFNLPGLALMAYVGWLTATGFLQGHYLSSDFFMHALLTIALVLLLSFFLLQGIIRLAVGRDRIQRRAFEDVEQAVARQPFSLSGPVSRQVTAVIELADDAGVGEDS